MNLINRDCKDLLEGQPVTVREFLGECYRLLACVGLAAAVVLWAMLLAVTAGEGMSIDRGGLVDAKPLEPRHPTAHIDLQSVYCGNKWAEWCAEQ